MQYRYFESLRLFQPISCLHFINCLIHLKPLKMKKFYFLASALLAVTTLKAQTTVDFEDLTLPSAESYYNGSDEAGEFTSGGVTFGNAYNTDWGSWSGFSYSNITDNTTAGFANQYSAIPGVGVNSSENYAVYTNGDTLYLPGTHADLISVQLSNTTYAYFSMKDGDQFAKQFGSPNGADESPDGTEGEDFFFVRIYGHDGSDALVDSVDFYLADYRFADDTEDYIVDTWTNVDLSTLTGVSYLTFDFHSSDVGDWGINTPQYFAMDDFIYKNTTGVAQQELTSFEMYPNPANHQLNIQGDAGTYVVFNINGEKIIEFQHTDFTIVDVSRLNSGIYFVKNTDSSSVNTRKLIIQ